MITDHHRPSDELTAVVAHHRRFWKVSVSGCPVLDDVTGNTLIAVVNRHRLVRMTSTSVGWEVACEVLSDPDPDLPPPLFFLSYARSGTGHRPIGPVREPDAQVIRLFDDLSENVAQLVSRAVGVDPGFMDRSMPGGVRWTPELLNAVGTCQVFVALLSTPYFGSEWCGMEWYAFSQRSVVKSDKDASKNEAAIVPVIWAPLNVSPPSAVSAVETFSPANLPDPAIARQYQAEGIFGLLKVDGPYEAVVWRLALRIAEIHYGHRVEPRTFGRDDLLDIFRE